MKINQAKFFPLGSTCTSAFLQSLAMKAELEEVHVSVQQILMEDLLCGYDSHQEGHCPVFMTLTFFHGELDKK